MKQKLLWVVMACLTFSVYSMHRTLFDSKVLSKVVFSVEKSFALRRVYGYQVDEYIKNQPVYTTGAMKLSANKKKILGNVLADLAFSPRMASTVFDICGEDKIVQQVGALYMLPESSTKVSAYMFACAQLAADLKLDIVGYAGMPGWSEAMNTYREYDASIQLALAARYYRNMQRSLFPAAALCAPCFKKEFAERQARAYKKTCDADVQAGHVFAHAQNQRSYFDFFLGKKKPCCVSSACNKSVDVCCDMTLAQVSDKAGEKKV